MINIFSPSRYTLEKKALKKAVSFFLKQKDVDETVELNLIFIGKEK